MPTGTFNTENRIVRNKAIAKMETARHKPHALKAQHMSRRHPLGELLLSVDIGPSPSTFASKSISWIALDKDIQATVARTNDIQGLGSDEMSIRVSLAHQATKIA
jgi:hypothetical protein